MNPNIRDILEFTSEPEIAALVSRDWRNEVFQNQRNIIEGLQRDYNNLDIQDMPQIIIIDNNIDAMRRLTLLRPALDWNNYAYFFMKHGTNAMMSLIFPYLNETNQVLIAGRRGIILDRYPPLSQTNLQIPKDIRGSEAELYHAILFGNVNLFKHLMYRLTMRWNIIDGAVDQFLYDNGIIPPKILDALIYEFVDSGKYSPTSNGLTTTLAMVRNMVQSRINPKQQIDIALNNGIEIDDIYWLPVYLSIILANDDLELFQQLYEIVGDIHPISFTFMGGDKIIQYVLSKSQLLDYITEYSDEHTSYQSLDMQYFIKNATI